MGDGIGREGGRDGREGEKGEREKGMGGGKPAIPMHGCILLTAEAVRERV